MLPEGEEALFLFPFLQEFCSAQILQPGYPSPLIHSQTVPGFLIHFIPKDPSSLSYTQMQSLNLFCSDLFSALQDDTKALHWHWKEVGIEMITKQWPEIWKRQTVGLNQLEPEVTNAQLILTSTREERENDRGTSAPWERHVILYELKCPWSHRKGLALHAGKRGV